MENIEYIYINPYGSTVTEPEVIGESWRHVPNLQVRGGSSRTL